MAIDSQDSSISSSSNEGAVVVDKKMHVLGRKGLVVVFVILIMAIVALIVGIVIINSNKNGGGDEEDEDAANTFSVLQERAASVIYSDEYNGDDVEVLALVTDLEFAIEETDDEYDWSMECVLLSKTWASVEQMEKAEKAIDKCLNKEGISDEARYNLLTQTLDLAGEKEDTALQLEILKKIVKLPDDMVLEYLDWKEVKKMYLETIERLEGSND